MAKVTFKVVTPEKFQAGIPKVDGQLLFVHDKDTGLGQIYLDYDDVRVKYTTDPGMNYVGIAEEDPSQIAYENGKIKLTTGEYVPNFKDVVVWDRKEYMWRPDKDEDNKFKWMEIGDEDVPSWVVEN